MVLTVLLLVATTGAWYWYGKSTSSYDYDNLAAHEKIAKERVIAQVSRLMALPEKESPQMYTIGDEQSAAKEAFLKDARRGDVVLVYTGARQAIVYRQSESKIVSVATLTEPTRPPASSGQSPQ